MSYPEPQYHGSTGEATATWRGADQPPELTYPSGNTAHYLATGATTGGTYGLYRWVMGPEPSGPGPHFHRSITESFYILTGEIRIYDGREWRPCHPGDFVHVPIGGIHGFRNESGAPASMLLHFAPGAPREGYFEGLAEWGRTGRPSDEAEIAAFYLRHDNVWLPEPTESGGRPMRIRALLEQNGKTAVGFAVPEDVVLALGKGKRPPVRVTINGYTYRSTVAPMGGRYLIGVSADNRAAAGVAGGQTHEIELELDDAPREVALPPDFDAALAAEPAARRTFDGLSPSNKGYHVSLIESAKSDETRARRIEKSIAALRDGKPR